LRLGEGSSFLIAATRSFDPDPHRETDLMADVVREKSGRAHSSRPPSCRAGRWPHTSWSRQRCDRGAEDPWAGSGVWPAWARASATSSPTT